MSDIKPETPSDETLLREAFSEITGHSPSRESTDISPKRWRPRQLPQSHPRPRGAIALVAAVVLLIGGVLVTTHDSLLGSSTPEQTTAGADTSPNVQVLPTGETLERFSSASAEDWTRNSDYVAEVSVLSEDRTGADEGRAFVGREVTLNVERVLWQRSQPAHALPAQVPLWAPGWSRDEDQGSALVPRAFERQPRLEVGHTYVISMVWIPRACGPGDGEEAAHWSALGANAVIPFDNGRLGYGESEGRSVVGDEDQTQPGTLERQLLGNDAEQLVKSLESAPQGARSEVFPEATC